MSIVRRATSSLVSWVLTLAIGVVTPSTNAGALTDMWWVPSESGWGVNLVQQDDTLFLTFFLYGTDGRASWFSASAVRDDADAPKFAGALYESSGPSYGGGFDPGAVRRTQVGIASFSPSPDGTATLTYTVGERTVTKSVERLTYRAIPLLPAFPSPGPEALYAPFSGTIQFERMSLSCQGGAGGEAPFTQAKGFAMYAQPTDLVSGTIRIESSQLRLSGTYRQAGSGFRVSLESTVTPDSSGFLPPGRYVGGMDPLTVDGLFAYGYVDLTGDNLCKARFALAGHVNAITYELP